MSRRRSILTTIGRPHGPGVVLARRYPGDDQLRALAIEHWQHASYSLRQRIDRGIAIQLPTREQTALEAALPRDLCDALNGWPKPTIEARRSAARFRPAPIETTFIELHVTPPARRAGTASPLKPRPVYFRAL